MFSNRMMAWFSPSMIAPNDFLMERLRQLAEEYDSSGGGLSKRRMDEIFAESDKIQAELWRRHVHGMTWPWQPDGGGGQ